MTVAPPPPPPPAIVAPAPREVSFGRVAGTAAPAVRRVVVSAGGRVLGAGRVRSGRFSLTVELPRRSVTVRVTALDARGNRSSAAVGPVLGLPPRAAPAPAPAHEDAELARTVERLVRSFPGTAAAYVVDLGGGAGAAWNAGARFPAASTLKLAIAIEVLRTLRAKPAAGSRVDVLLRRMLRLSDNRAANELLVRIGGSTAAGGMRVSETMRTLGASDSLMYGGYELQAAAARPIPLRVESQPAFGRGKYTTAHDLARLARLLHLAAGGRGELARRFRGGFTPSDARFLLYHLAHSGDRGRLDRFVPDATVAHKAGWVERARHDAGLVYWRGGAFAVAVMTWNGRGAGGASDVLAGRVARVALDRFRRAGEP